MIIESAVSLGMHGMKQGGPSSKPGAFCTHRSSDDSNECGGALLPQRTHICFLGGGCPGDPSWLKCLGGMSGACLGPSFKYPGPGGGHARNQTPPDQRQWTRHECKDPVFSSTPHMNGHYSERFVKIYAMYTGDTPHRIHSFTA